MRPPDQDPADARLARTLGLGDAVTIGLGAMLGAGVFVAFGPAAGAAGAGLPWALVLAAAIAWANADSTARLAALLPTSGGAYAYGRARLSPAWGTAAGVAFLVGKTVSAGAIATTVGAYVWPEHARAVGVAAVVALTALACAGVERSARVTLVVVALVLLTLATVVVVALTSGGATDGLVATLRGALASPDALTGPGTTGAAGSAAAQAWDARGVLMGAGILFFAFAGYARIATLGEEVRDPRRTLPRAIAVALGIVLVTYAAVGAAVLHVLGLAGVAASGRPVADAVEVVGGPAWAVPVALVAGVAALASGLGVLLGLSRTSLAMARDGVLPRSLARLDGRGHGGRGHGGRPVRAQVAIGAAVVVGILVVELDRAIALSSAAVLVYYGIAHAAALTLPGAARRLVPVLGLLGCGVVAAALLLG